jgi:hypothetical protein
MKNIIRLSFILVLSLLCYSLIAQKEDTHLLGDLKPGPQTVGFSVEHHYDYSRTFRKKEDSPEEIARPVQILIWYPAQNDSVHKHMKYREYLFLAATELDFTPPDENREWALINQLSQRPMGEDKILGDSPLFKNALDKDTLAIKNAVPSPGPFPLIIYAPGGGDQAFDNHILCEYLASNGYIVASCPSFGYDSREYGADHIGIESHIRDSEFVMAKLLLFSNVDKNRIGTIGYSWGGLSSVFFAMRNSRINALVSLDGAEHMSHRIKTMRSFPFFPMIRKLKAASMHISVAGRTHDFGFYKELKYSDAYHLHFPNLRHGLIGSRNLYLLMNPREDIPSPIKEYMNNGYAIICRYTLNFLNAYLKKDQNSQDFIQNSPEVNGIRRGMLIIESKKAQEIPPMDEKFFSIIQNQGVDEAMKLFTELRKKDPTIVLFDEMPMNNLGYRFLNAGQLNDSVKILRMNVETYPKSWNVYDSLADAYSALGDKEKAIANYEKSLELNPENTPALRKIKELKRGEKNN